MKLIPQLFFIVLITIAIFLFTRKLKQIRKNILLGKDEDLSDNKKLRIKNLLLLAFGQKKMFANPMVAIMHLIIYLGFIIINIEVIEIILDGILGSHRLFAAILSKSVYVFLINCFELLAVGVLVVCIVFLTRRHLMKINRFTSKDLDGAPRTDATIILTVEIILMALFLTMNAADTLLQLKGAEHYSTNTTGNFIFSYLLHPIFTSFSINGLIMVERICWWLHIIGILIFLNYLPYSKHLHIVLAFVNAYYAKLQPAGVIKNMESVQNEVLYAMQPELAPTETIVTTSFGAKDIFDLSWKNLLDAYSCTECGRCSTACPANITGKLLSPRSIMMKTRDRVEEVGKNIAINKQFVNDEKSLLHHYITVEELRACTTCNACVEACPVSISPLDIIIELRRSLIMEEGNAPQEWNATFSNIENNFAPWKFSTNDRDKWADEIQ